MSLPILCVVCPGEVKVDEDKYVEHMHLVHGGSQATGRIINKNIPLAPLPTGVNPSDLPTPEFLQTIEEMEKAKIAPKPPVTPPVKPQMPSMTLPSREPIQLTYKYTGNCPLGHGITTLEMDVMGQHFVVAYCLAESRQIESREVANLKITAYDKFKKSQDEAKEGLVVFKKNKIFKLSNNKTPSVMAKPPVPPSPKKRARQSDKPKRDLTEGVPQKEVPIIAQKDKQ